MSGAVGEGVAEAVEGAKSPKKKKSSRSANSRAKKGAAAPPAAQSEADLPEFDPSERPEPESNIKTVEGICGKYQVAEDLDMSVQIHRLWPQYYPDGQTKATGYLEESQDAITTGYIQTKYGGGKYKVQVMGPSKDGRGRRSYAVTTVDIPGPMNVNALNRTAREEHAMGIVGAVQQQGAQAPTEAPGVATKAMELVGSMNERSASRISALEEQLLQRSGGDGEVLNLVRELNETHLRSLEQAQENERQLARDRLATERQERERLEARLAALEGEQRRDSHVAADRFNDVLGRSAESQERLLQNTIDRHNEALRQQRESHEQAVKAMRESFEAEKRVAHENHQRDMEANDRRWEAKVERVERRIDELEALRKRDQEDFERRLRDREEALRLQAKNTEQLIETSWEARFTSLKSTHEVQVQGYEERLATYRSDLADAKAQVASQGDAFAQIEKAKSLLEVGRDLAGGSSGSSGSDKDQGIVDKLIDVVGVDPAGLLQVLLGRAGAAPGGMPGAPPGLTPIQLAPQPGFHPMGMGQMPPQPAQMGGPPPWQQQSLPPTAPPPRQQVMQGPADLEDLLDDELEDERDREREEHYRRARAQRQHHAPPPAPPPQTIVQQPAARPQGPPQPMPQLPIRPEEVRVLANFIGKALDDGDDPDEFAEQAFRVLQPQQVVALLQAGPDVVLRLIEQHAPKSEALSPFGRQFVNEVFHHMLAIAQQIQQGQPPPQ